MSRRRSALQAAAVFIILTVALLADRLMDSLGPLGFLLTAGPAIAVAGALVRISNKRG